MGRFRSRSRSCSPRRSRTPPRRKRYDDPRDRHRGGGSRRDRRSPAPTGLLVRNVALATRPEDLRKPFERFGPVKDVYLPKNYYTGEPRGFGFVKFHYPEDAACAKARLDRSLIDGREIRIVYAEENRKTPQEMRRTAPVSSRHGGRKTSLRSPRSRHPHSRSPSPSRHYSRSVSRSRSPRKRSPSLSDTSPDGRGYRSRLRSQSPRKISPHDEKNHRSSKRSHSPREISPNDEKSHRSSKRSCSPRERSRLDDHRPSKRSSRSRDRRSRSRDVLDDDKRGRRSSLLSRGQISPQARDDNSKEKSTSPKNVSPDNHLSSKLSGSPHNLSPRSERKSRLSLRSPSPRDLSPQDHRLESPRRNGRSMSRSPKSHSPQ